jgi:hypothetical protein
MQFAFWQEGPAGQCRDKCAPFVTASGMIKPDTVEVFERFAARHDLRGLTIAFDSLGGSVHGAIALGRAIRRLEMITTVGRAKPVPGAKGALPRASLSPSADCESMCPFVLLGGIKRTVPADARVRVHQIWLGDRRDDANAATYTAEDLVLVQRDIGKLAQYTIEMGGGADLLEVALRIPPWEPMHALTRDELRRMKLDTAEVRSDAAAIAAMASSGSTASARPSSAAGDLGWTLIERSGRAMLVRQHPLTVEGVTIGHFNVALTCSQAPGEFAVLYSETRHSKDAGGVPAPLSDVAIFVGRQQTLLTVGTSEVRNSSGERSSAASGLLPASVFKLFADPGSHSLTVSTVSANKFETAIRLGNTGVAQALPQLAAACTQHGTQALAQHN